MKTLPLTKRKIAMASMVMALLIGSSGFLLVPKASAATKCWTGQGSTNNWSDTGNWAGGVLPTTTDVATFHGASCTTGTPDKSVTIDQNVDLSGTGGGINIGSNYTGTITQGTGFTISAGTNGWVQAGGSFSGGNASITLTGSFTLSGGSFTSTSGTLTTTGIITFSGSSTFTHNSGTVTLSGTGGTMSCNSQTFNLVTINLSSSDLTVSSNCTLPLGNNPSVTLWSGGGNKIILNGTLSGSGTISINGGLTLNSGAVLSGFTGLDTTIGSSSLGLTIAGATLNAGSYTTFTVKVFTMSSGTFTAPSGTMSIVGNFTISSGTFNANGGTVSFSGHDGATIACNNSTFNLVNFNKTGNDQVVNSDCNLPLGNNPSVVLWSGNANKLTLNGTLTGTGTLSINGGLTLNSGAVLSGFSGLSLSGSSATTLTISGATFNASSYTTFSLASGMSFTESSGNFTAPNAGMTVPSTFTLSSGTFTASSGTTTIQGNISISGSPTFNANGGTVALTGNDNSTYTCNNVTFNLVTISKTTFTGSNVTVNSSCNFPLGNNPTVTLANSVDAIILNGTLSGSGTITFTNSGLKLNSGSSLSGFSGLTTTGAFTVQGGTFNASNYSPLTVSSTFALSSGTFTAPSGTMTIQGAITITGGTFNANNGTIALTGSDGPFTYACNNVTFNLITITKTVFTGSPFTVNADCTFPLGANPTVSFANNADGVTLIGTFTGSGTLSFSNALLTASGGTLSGFTDVVISGYFSLSSGYTFTAPPGTTTVSGNFTNSGGTFIANGGTVKLNSTFSQTFTGTTTFYNLTIINGGARQITFPASSTQTVSNAFTVTGTNSGSKVLLRSSSSGTQWGVDVRGTASVLYADIKDSNACQSVGHPLVATNSTDSGNNSCWNFVTSGAKNPTFIFKGVTIGPGTLITGN